MANFISKENVIIFLFSVKKEEYIFIFQKKLTAQGL